MKTATITWITYNNYGTMLQAYALQKSIKKLGCENEIISDKFIVFRNNNFQNSNNIEKKSFKRKIFIGLLHPNKTIKFLINKYRVLLNTKIERPYIYSQETFDEFRNKKLIINYDIKSTIDILNNNYDCYVCGSDQIWSVLDVNFNGYFYLDFIKGKKIAYAPSIGTINISDEKGKKIKSWLTDYNAISVREKASMEQLTTLTNKNIEWVSDPTILLDEKEWSLLFTDNVLKSKKYLICYFLEDKDWYFSYARDLASYLNLKVVIIPNLKSHTHIKECLKHPVSPEMFITLIKDSSFVLTDSYHGSIFSLLFSKQFIHLKRFKDTDIACQNIRVDSLFSYLNIENIIVEEVKFKNSDIFRINYDIVHKKLNEFRIKSFNFLKESLYG